MQAIENALTGERGELLRSLAEQRDILRIAVRGIDDEQSATRTTASELTLGGLIKHLTRGEVVWTQIMRARDGALPDGMLDPDQYRVCGGDTLTGLLDAYATSARETDKLVAALPDLDVVVPLPTMPWSPPEPVRWSARRVLLHLIRETAQHAGHADIIRESLDGASTTGQLDIASILRDGMAGSESQLH